MNMMYDFFVQENEKLTKQVEELTNFLNTVKTTCYHLLHDGDVSEQGKQSVNDILRQAEELQEKHHVQKMFDKIDKIKIPHGSLAATGKDNNETG